MTHVQIWSAAAGALVALCLLYAEDVPDVLDWLAWNSAETLISARMALWRAWLGPRLRFETWARGRRARRRLREYDKENNTHKPHDR